MQLIFTIWFYLLFVPQSYGSANQLDVDIVSPERLSRNENCCTDTRCDSAKSQKPFSSSSRPLCPLNIADTGRAHRRLQNKNGFAQANESDSVGAISQILTLPYSPHDTAGWNQNRIDCVVKFKREWLLDCLLSVERMRMQTMCSPIRTVHAVRLLLGHSETICMHVLNTEDTVRCTKLSVSR